MKASRISIWLLIMVFFCHSLAYSFGPIFEGPDEIEHYRFIRTLQATQALPAPDGQAYGQYHQAPLYYLLMLPLANLLPDSDFDGIDGRLNPYHGYDFARPGNDNKNVYLHYQDESLPFPESETARAVHILRILSILLGTGTLVLIAAILARLWPDKPYRQLFGVSILALWPQFAYIISTINNDNLAFFLATATFYLCIRELQDDADWRTAILLGIVLGAALLTKASLGWLAIPVGLITVLRPHRWPYAAITLVLTIAIAGWWYWRNYVLTGDPTGIQAMFNSWPTQSLDTGRFALEQGFERAVYGYRTLWARFGHGAVAVSDMHYAFYDLMTLGSILGLILLTLRRLHQGILNRKELLLWAFIVTFAAIWVISLVSSASVAVAGNQGRYLFPGIAAWIIFISLGLDSLLRLSYVQRLIYLLIVIFGISASSALFGYFYPAYQVLPLPEQIEAPLNLRFEDAAELIGISSHTIEAEPGETISVELYWRAETAQSRTLQSFLHSAFAEHVIWRDSIPGNGHRPAQDWQAGETWTERYVIVLPEDLPLGSEFLITAGLYEPEASMSLRAIDASGDDQSDAPIVAILKILPSYN